MAHSRLWKSIRLLSAFTLLSFSSVCHGNCAPSPAAPPDRDKKRSVDAAVAVKRANTLVELWRHDKSPAHLDEALDVLERARNTRYGKAVVLAWIGYIHLERGDVAQAVAPLREAVQIGPNTSGPYIDLAYALDNQGQSVEAAGYLKTAATLVPPDNSNKESFRGKHDLVLRHIYLDLGGVSLRAHHDADAVQAYRQAESLNGRVTSQVTAESRHRLDARSRDYLDEDEPRIYAALGAALRQSAQYKDAIAASEQATILRPSNGVYWRRLAESYQSAAVHGKPGEPETIQLWEHAADAYAKALPAFPTDAALHDLYGTALSEAGRHAAAVKEFTSAGALRPADAKPSANALFHYGLSEWQLGNSTHAGALFQQSGQIDPMRSQTLQWQGFAALRTFDPKSAIEPLTRAAQIDPNSVATQLDLGAAYVQTAHPDLALSHFQKAVELQPDSLEGNYALGRTLFDLKRYIEAAKAFRRAGELFASHDSGRPVILYGQGDRKLTRAEIQHALGYSLELAGDLAGAAEVHESASEGGTNIEMTRYAAWERYLLATREPSEANWSRAEQALGRAVQVQPNRTILESYGDTLSYERKQSEAAQQYARAVQIGLTEPRSGNLDPETSVYALREKYGDTLRTLGRDDEAIAQLEAAVPRDPEPYNALVVLGILYRKQASRAAAKVDKPARDSWNSKAEAVYLRALDQTIPPTAPNSPVTPPKLQIRKALAPIQYGLGKYDEAGNTAAEILKEDPGDVNIAILRYKYLYERKGDGDAARSVLENALKYASSPAPADNHAILMADRAVAFQYLRHGPQSAFDLHQAGVFYNRALELQPQDAESLNGKGIIAMHRKQYAEAVDQFKRAVAADPHNSDAYNNLGEAYEHLKGDHFSDTLQCYRRAYQENPDLSAARLNMARYTKYAKFGWESKDHMTSFDSIPVYHRRTQPAPRKHRRRR